MPKAVPVNTARYFQSVLNQHGNNVKFEEKIEEPAKLAPNQFVQEFAIDTDENGKFIPESIRTTDGSKPNPEALEQLKNLTAEKK